jgi:choline dehydrogenase-like flavoprotein
MASFDYDVVIIGSGFGGSVAALRAAEKGYRVGVMEAGRRWKEEDRGLLTGTTIMCQCHGSRFDVSSGAVVNGPATKALKVHEAREVEGSIQIRA